MNSFIHTMIDRIREGAFSGHVYWRPKQRCHTSSICLGEIFPALMMGRLG
jgi:hypothetical protein